MTDAAVIILAKNEKLHIARCLERLAPLEPRQIFVMDCFSTDGSDKTAKELGATVVQHEWPGNQAKQFNWALDNLPIKASWVLRLDADEYLYPDTIEEVKTLLPKWDGENVTDGGLPPDVTSLSLSLSREFSAAAKSALAVPRTFRWCASSSMASVVARTARWTSIS